MVQIKTIRNMVSKALSNKEMSAAEFEKILSQIAKKNQTYRSFDAVKLEFEKLFPGKNSVV